ncbi:hypothetical protein FQN50_004257 [Emmonsiellopsis sp. PD_5]|nr:hypothetical protein FQN50_004257 [Emmonsiellopsis sp. PD_5]
MFAFMLIGLFFVFLSLMTGLLALCTSIGGWISAFLATIGLILQIVTTALMTAGYVRGKNAFSSNGQPAKVGAKAFAWMWTSVFLLFVASVLYCVSGVSGTPKRRTGNTGGRKRGGLFGSRGKRKSTNGVPEKSEYSV